MIQLSLLDAIESRNAGIKTAVDHADHKIKSWQDRAYSFLLAYSKPCFQVEEVRQAAEGIVPEAPNARAWGGIILRAAKAGKVERIGFKNTSNVKAHRTPASVWRFT